MNAKPLNTATLYAATDDQLRAEISYLRATPETKLARMSRGSLIRTLQTILRERASL